MHDDDNGLENDDDGLENYDDGLENDILFISSSKRIRLKVEVINVGIENSSLETVWIEHSDRALQKNTITCDCSAQGRNKRFVTSTPFHSVQWCSMDTREDAHEGKDNSKKDNDKKDMEKKGYQQVSWKKFGRDTDEIVVGIVFSSKRRNGVFAITTSCKTTVGKTSNFDTSRDKKDECKENCLSVIVFGV